MTTNVNADSRNSWNSTVRASGETSEGEAASPAPRTARMPVRRRDEADAGGSTIIPAAVSVSPCRAAARISASPGARSIPKSCSSDGRRRSASTTSAVSPDCARARLSPAVTRALPFSARGLVTSSTF